jgi:hypothetical protein
LITRANKEWSKRLKNQAKNILNVKSAVSLIKIDKLPKNARITAKRIMPAAQK